METLDEAIVMVCLGLEDFLKANSWKIPNDEFNRKVADKYGHSSSSVQIGRAATRLDLKSVTIGKKRGREIPSLLLKVFKAVHYSSTCRNRRTSEFKGDEASAVKVHLPHMNTKEFREQREALKELDARSEAKRQELATTQTERDRALAHLRELSEQAKEAEDILQQEPAPPKPTVLNYKAVCDGRVQRLKLLKKPLADKRVSASKKHMHSHAQKRSRK